MEGKGFIMKIPLGWQVEKFPFAPSFFTAVVVGVFVLPTLLGSWRIPNDLGIRPHQNVIPPAFQFFTPGAVNDFVFFPVICNPHK